MTRAQCITKAEICEALINAHLRQQRPTVPDDMSFRVEDGRFYIGIGVDAGQTQRLVVKSHQSGWSVTRFDLKPGTMGWSQVVVVRSDEMVVYPIADALEFV